jgi:hypothetical protein
LSPGPAGVHSDVEDVTPENINIPSAVFTIASPLSSVAPENGALGTVLFLITNLVCLIAIFYFLFINIIIIIKN